MNHRLTVTWLAGLGLITGVALWLRSPSNRENVSPVGTNVSHGIVSAARSVAQKKYPASTTAKADEPIDSRWVRLESVMTYIQAEANPIQREALLTSTVDAIELGEIPSVLACLQMANNTECAAEMSKRLVRRWAAHDLRSATDWVEGLSDGQVRQEALNSLAIEWADQNPSEAADWARRLSGEREQFASLTAIANEFTRSEPLNSLRISVELSPSPQRDDLIRHAAMEWATRDAVGAAAWARQIGDDALRQQVLASVAMAWTDRDPISAATLAATHLPTGRLQDDAVMGIVERWVQIEPNAAANWVAQFPDGILRQNAVEVLGQLWPQTEH